MSLLVISSTFGATHAHYLMKKW